MNGDVLALSSVNDLSLCASYPDPDIASIVAAVQAASERPGAPMDAFDVGDVAEELLDNDREDLLERLYEIDLLAFEGGAEDEDGNVSLAPVCDDMLLEFAAEVQRELERCNMPPPPPEEIPDGIDDVLRRLDDELWGAEHRAAAVLKLPHLRMATRGTLNARPSREEKEIVSHEIVSWAQKHRLLGLDQDGAVLWIDPSGIVVPLADNQHMRAVLSALGVNSTETMFRWILEDLRIAAATDNSCRVVIRRYAHIMKDAIYLSCGLYRAVKASASGLSVVPNGTDGVFFTSEACYPDWDICQPTRPSSLAALSPHLHAPAESADYLPEYQAMLFEAWIAAAVAGLRPLPLLVLLGQASSGKSTTARGLAMTVRGPSADVSGCPAQQRDIEALLCGLPIALLDNVDTAVCPEWLQDMLCKAATGARVEQRKLHENFVVTARPMTAAVVMTSRTATWAGRADVQDRCLPCFFSERADSTRMDDGALMAEVNANRNGIMSWVAETAAAGLLGPARAGLPSRFQAFARLVIHIAPEHGREALERFTWAARTAIVDIHPLIQAILSCQMEVKGTPSGIVAQLKKDGRDIPFLGGGKQIANLLREHRRLFPYFDEKTEGNNRIFIISSSRGPGEPGETGDSTFFRGIEAEEETEEWWHR
jgi:hypothetical protein